MSEKKVRHVLGLSGGKDSTALALYMKKKHPELYEELYGFYRVNPVEWE